MSHKTRIGRTSIENKVIQEYWAQQNSRPAAAEKGGYPMGEREQTTIRLPAGLNEQLQREAGNQLVGLWLTSFTPPNDVRKTGIRTCFYE